MSERILCAAIWMKDFEHPIHSPKNIDIGAVYCGWRHHNIINLLYTTTGKPMSAQGNYEQGFLTSTGRFVDREEAMKIAISANQLNDRQHHEYDLFSEDLY